MSNQYARVKNVAKWEDVIKDITDKTYDFVDEFHEEAMKNSSLYEAYEDVDYEYWSSNHNAHATISISNSHHNKCMNLLYLPDKYHIIILDGGADTCVYNETANHSLLSEFQLKDFGEKVVSICQDMEELGKW
jgi:phosphoserine aminotransferase